MFEKIKYSINKYGIFVFAFVLPVFILGLYLLINHVSYKDFFISDLQGQYSNFFYYLKDVMNGDASPFYSFYQQLGGSMLGTLIYYLSSPFNLLLLNYKILKK